MKFSLEHVALAEPMMMQISYHNSHGTIILRSHGLEPLGDLLPLAAEFWRSSMSSLFSLVLEEPFPTKLMTFPFPAPAHWRSYSQMFNCKVEFDAEWLEWHFEANLLERPSPNANISTAAVCAEACQRILTRLPREASLTRQVKAYCIAFPLGFPSAEVVAGKLCYSVRTLHRRLANEGTSYQDILDGVRRQMAIGQLENTNKSVDLIAESVGFSDAATFRRAFKKWTGNPPTHYRK